ncbi:MAG: S8 family peptidase [Anaerolineae bacterium]|nr:S8 family peptidase [Gloeobacterales cyanobacterium ES-bin-313]
MRTKKFVITCLAIVISVTGNLPVLASPVQGQSKLHRQKRAVAGQYIVKFRDDISKAEIRQIADGLNLRNLPVLHLYSRAFNGFAIRMSAEQAQDLSQDGRVEYVEEDAVMALTEVAAAPCSTAAGDGHIPTCISQQTPTWDLDRMDQSTTTLDSLYTQTGTGKNVNVYVMDTGILTTHPDFQGRATAVYDAINDGNGGTDCNGHGTFSAGLIGGYEYGVAKEANLKSVRVLDCSGGGTTSGVIAGIDWISTNAPISSIVNMSLGGDANTPLDTAVENAISLGFIYVVAAGNNNIDVAEVSPARVSSAITVGSIDSLDNVADFSNYGTLVDYYVPGVDVISAYTGETGRAIGSGTSFSAPLVAGLFAVQLELALDPMVGAQTAANILEANAFGNLAVDPDSTGSSDPSGIAATNIGKLKNFNIGKLKNF